MERNQELQIIETFIRDFSPEIGGRSAGGLTSDLKNKLVRLSRGILSPEERRAISKRLLNDQEAMDFLLELVNGSAPGAG